MARGDSKSAAALTAANVEKLIMVMGKSGNGKTSLINLISGSTLRTSGSLASCTETIEFSEPFEIDGVRYRLLDSPGFDDSSKSDTDILSVIATFLADEYATGRKLTGIIYLHSIADVRMGNISRRNFVMFQKFCGPSFLNNVVLVTTRWDNVKQAVGEMREQELRAKPAFFKPVLDAGASMMRHDRSIVAATKIIQHFASKTPAALLVQKEMVDEGKTVAQTQAGLELQTEYQEQLRKHEENMQKLVKEREEAHESNDQEATADVEAEIKDLRRTVAHLEEENRKLQSMTRSPSTVRESGWNIIKKTLFGGSLPNESSTQGRGAKPTPLNNGKQRPNRWRVVATVTGVVRWLLGNRWYRP